MSRVDAVRIAVAKAASSGRPRGSALASDAYFLPDGPQIALDAALRRSSSPAAHAVTRT
jgi:AICAR transformylase/IMP cyclohydrolase PurH